MLHFGLKHFTKEASQELSAWVSAQQVAPGWI